MADVNSAIALAGKPVQLPDFEVGKTLLTLGQLKALNAHTAILQAEEARAAQTFADAQGQPRLLASLSRRPVGQALAPGVPQATEPGPVRSEAMPLVTPTSAPVYPDAQPPPPASSPPSGGASPGGPEAAPGGPGGFQGAILNPDVQNAIRAAHPVKSEEFIQSALKTSLSDLEAQQKKFENVARGLALVTDEPSMQAWLASARTQVDPETFARFPQHYEGPQQIDALRTNAQSLDARFKQALEQGSLAVAEQGARTAQYGAETGRLAEQRAGIGTTVLTGPLGQRLAQTYQQIPGGVGPLIPGTEAPLGGGEAAAMGLVTMAQEAHGIGTVLAKEHPEVYSLVDKATGKVPANLLTSTAYQQYVAAQQRFATALSHGVPPPEAEAERLNRLYWPQANEGPEVIAQKEQARNTAMQGLQNATGRPVGYIPPAQQPLPAGSPRRPVTQAQVQEIARHAGKTVAEITKIITDGGGRILP
jgi:hypothetical protein